MTQWLTDDERVQVFADMQEHTERFMSRVESIQNRVGIDPDDEDAVRKGKHNFLLYTEIIRLEDEVAKKEGGD